MVNSGVEKKKTIRANYLGSCVEWWSVRAQTCVAIVKKTEETPVKKS